MILRTSEHLRIEENLTSTGGLVKKLRLLIRDSGPDDVEATRFS
jgi:hypothetical protein